MNRTAQAIFVHELIDNVRDEGCPNSGYSNARRYTYWHGPVYDASTRRSANHYFDWTFCKDGNGNEVGRGEVSSVRTTQ